LRFSRPCGFAEVGQRSLADLRNDTYGRLIRLPMAFHTQRRVGELASRISADLTQIQDTLIWTIPQFLRQLALMVGGLALLIFTSGRLTLAMLLSLPILIAASAFFGRRIRRIARESRPPGRQPCHRRGDAAGGGQRQGVRQRALRSGRYRESLQAYLSAVLRSARYRAAFNRFRGLRAVWAIIFVLWYGARLVQSGDLTARAAHAVHAVHDVRWRRHG